MLGWKQFDNIISEHTKEICSPRIIANPLISVCFITWNHAKFIKQAINSVLNQHTCFPFEIVIGDDASDDGTSDIVDQYQRAHPDQIRVLRSTTNLGKVSGTTFQLNFARNLKTCKGTYIALLEGDDLWTDNDKLQDQVSFLESNPDYMGACHDTSVIASNGALISAPNFFVSQNDKLDLYFNDTVSRRCPFHTSSFIFKKKICESLPKWLLTIPYVDRPLMHLTAAKNGPIRRIPKVMSHYRKHPGGATSTTLTAGLDLNKIQVKWNHTMKRYFSPLGKDAFDLLLDEYENALVHSVIHSGQLSEYPGPIALLLRNGSFLHAQTLIFKFSKTVFYRIQMRLAALIPRGLKKLFAK